MPTSNWQLNRFERALFSVAILLAVILVVVRLGAILTLWVVHHH